MKKYKVFVKDCGGNVYECDWEFEDNIETYAKSKRLLREMIKEVIEEFETKNITIWINDCIIYKNKKATNLDYLCCPKMHKLNSFYNSILLR